MYKRKNVDFFFQQKVPAALVNKDWSVFYICSPYFSFYCAMVYSKAYNLFCSVFFFLTVVTKAEGSFINQFHTQTFFRKHSLICPFIHPSIWLAIHSSMIPLSPIGCLFIYSYVVCSLVCVPSFVVLSFILMLLTWSIY